jgi:hypothetical protein
MDHHETRSTNERAAAQQGARRSTAVVLAATLLSLRVAVGCAGANGDPPPEPQEAGVTEIPPCVDAGATE